MKTYIAFLRGINVSGQKKIKMADLRHFLTEAGLEEVHTYIQSGNVIFNGVGEKYAFAKAISEKILKEYNIEVPVLVYDLVDIEQVINKCPFTPEKQENSYYTLLYNTPESAAVSDFEKIAYPNEELILKDRCIYFYCSTGYGKAKYSNNLAERKLKVVATSRNHRTMTKLLELASYSGS